MASSPRAGIGRRVAQGGVGKPRVLVVEDSGANQMAEVVEDPTHPVAAGEAEARRWRRGEP
jgi:hypothetical protein